MPWEFFLIPGSPGAFLRCPSAFLGFHGGISKGYHGSYFPNYLTNENQFQIFDECKTKCKHHIASFLRNERGEKNSTQPFLNCTIPKNITGHHPMFLSDNSSYCLRVILVPFSFWQPIGCQATAGQSPKSHFCKNKNRPPEVWWGLKIFVTH